MINNSEYIKMILALPDEFFEGWEWNYGDTFILKVASDKWIVHHIGDFELINNDIGTWTPIGGCESTFEKVEEARRPIPSQEQLQTKIIKSQNCKRQMYSICSKLGIIYIRIKKIIECLIPFKKHGYIVICGLRRKNGMVNHGSEHN